MAWLKSPQALLDLFEEAVPDDPRVERRKMFGYPCAFVNGNMCMGLHQEDFIVRLSEEDRVAAKSELDAQPFEPMKGRVMREYVALPEAVLADEEQLVRWTGRSFAYVSGLAAKEKNAPSKKEETDQGLVHVTDRDYRL